MPRLIRTGWEVAELVCQGIVARGSGDGGRPFGGVRKKLAVVCLINNQDSEKDMETDAQTGGAKPKVVIVGGGFGGLYAAKVLAEKPVAVTLIDRTNHHLFQPLLYQVATAGLSPGDIAQPIRAILKDAKNIRVVMETVEAIDIDKRVVQTQVGAYEYEYLILAAGARHSYFG